MNPGVVVHVRDRVMTSCIEATTIEQPAVKEVWPDRPLDLGEHIWVRIGPGPVGAVGQPPSGTFTKEVRYLVAVDHWHLPEDCKTVRV